MNLLELYELKLKIFKEQGIREEPHKLLAMLLLPEKDNYEPLLVSEGIFYNTYKEQIDEKINKVIKDFSISDEDIIMMIEEKDIACDDFEHDKIWFVFANGFGAMHWGIMYHPEMSPERIYQENFGVVDYSVQKDKSLVKKTTNE